MGPQLQGRVALVTGATRGIGEAIARELARQGADIAVVGRDRTRAEQVAGEIQVLGRKAIPLTADVARFDDAERVVNAVVEQLGSLDILVNNAGITRDGLLVRMKEEDWDEVLAVNLKGTFNCSRAAARHMLRQRRGRIINVTSVVGEMGSAGQANYAASKAGIVGFTKAIARELGSRGITVNAVAPGYIQTAMTEAIGEKARAELLAQVPLGRLGTPADVAGVVAFLASDAAGYITGHVLDVNGGLYM
ncbi:MAG: 3-oxoacyl-[acyl-carrier-protein] reductase [Deltaproteobacteria bacterium]|nr:3-oxoacyl-[acyl-carrier-protein] reductase [Deltaproteobacteria bacterium]